MKNLSMVLVFFFFGNFTINAQEVTWDKTPFTSQNLSKLNRGAKTTVRIVNSIEVQGNVVVPKNVTLAFSEKGMLRIKDDKTRLQIAGKIVANRTQIFDLSARGVTSYRYESVSNIEFKTNKVIYPEWYGIMPNVVPGQKGNSSHKSQHHTHLKELMLDLAASGGGEIVFAEGVYYIRDVIIDSDNITVRGQDKKTILRFDRANYKYSTRRGGLFVIQGATLEKFYSKVVPEGMHLSGNYFYDTAQKTIENIVVKDLAIEWNLEATSDDPSMNGLTIMNSRNVTIDNVHVNMFGANRAFYIGSGFDLDVTENITIKNSSCVESRTGLFIIHGYQSKDPLRTHMSLGGIQVENNHFRLVPMAEIDVKNTHVTLKHLDPYSSGIYFIGNEFTKNTKSQGTNLTRSIGTFELKNNIIENADFGVRCWYPGKGDDRDFIHKVLIEGNTFLNFNYIGIFSTFKEVTINDNSFKSKSLSQLPLTIETERQEEFVASAIQIAKAPFKTFKTKLGPENVMISNNTFEGCYLGTTPVVLQPKKNGVIRLVKNAFKYDESCKKPTNDIQITTSNKKYRSKKATIFLKDNHQIKSNASIIPVSIDIDSKRRKHISLIED